MYYWGRGCEKDWEKSLYWFEQSARQGNVDGMFNTALAYEDGEGCQRDLRKAYDWFEQAAERGHAKAQLRCAQFREKPFGGMLASPLDAIAWYEKAAEQGVEEAYEPLLKYYDDNLEKKRYWWEKIAGDRDKSDDFYRCAQLWEQTKGAAVADMRRALEWYERAAQRGHTKAQLRAAQICDRGEGNAEVNKETAFIWYREAGERGERDPGALRRAAEMLYSGEGTVFPSKHEAFDFFEKAAKAGDAEAQFRCGQMAYTGDGVAVDLEEAKKWLAEAAAQGHAEAARLRKEISERPDERKKEHRRICDEAYDAIAAGDYERGARLFERAALQGNEIAQRQCADLYYAGKGVEKDLKKALYWYKTLARHGWVNAQFNCGVMYYKGEGTPVDLRAARQYFAKAAEHDDGEALFNLGVMCCLGQTGMKNLEEALGYFERAMEWDVPKAKANCALMYYHALGCTRDIDKSIELRDEQEMDGEQFDYDGIITEIEDTIR